MDLRIRNSKMLMYYPVTATGTVRGRSISKDYNIVLPIPQTIITKPAKVAGSRRKFEIAKRSNRTYVTSEERRTIKVSDPSFAKFQKSNQSELFMENFYVGTDVLQLHDDNIPKLNKNDLLTKAYAAANEREVDILTTLAELPETIRMFSDLLKAVRNPLNTLKELTKAQKRWKWVEVTLLVPKPGKWVKQNGKWVRPDIIKKVKTREKRFYWKGDWLSPVDIAAQAWLTYRYGVMPLLYTLQDITDALNKMRDQGLFETQKTREIFESDDTIEVRMIHTNVKVPARIKVKAIERVYIKSFYTPKAAMDKVAAFNPVLTAWELIPLSFVVDWFASVGDAIQALTPSCASSRAITYSAHVYMEVQIKGKVTWGPTKVGVNNFEIGDGEFTQSMTDDAYFREIIPDNPTQFVTIPTQLELNWKRQIDAAALLWPQVKDALLSVRNMRIRK